MTMSGMRTTSSVVYLEFDVLCVDKLILAMKSQGIVGDVRGRGLLSLSENREVNCWWGGHLTHFVAPKWFASYLFLSGNRVVSVPVGCF
jgi:hypothetical protein